MSKLGLSFDPLAAWWLIALAAAAAALIVVLALAARQRGAALRGLALGLFVLALANPSAVSEDRDKLDDVVALVIDRSASQEIGGRMAMTDAAKAGVEKLLAERPRTQVKVIEAGIGDGNQDGTRLFESLQAGLADVAPERLAGVIAITDGQVHDAPPSLRAIGIGAPFHALITGRAAERDRRVELIETPRFGIVGKTQVIEFRMMETGASFGPARLAVRREGQVVAQRAVAPGERVRLPVKIEHAGANLFEIEVDGAEGELTLINNKALVSIEGVRDKLKVLLISGEPHAGERTWRNILKADANVELVHFTILRPPEKQDSTPQGQLSLIQFPHRDLFGEKIKEFDLIIFDRYAMNPGVMPGYYMQNIARYVTDGGAVLLASGPEFAGAQSLMQTPLSQVIPARATGRVLEQPYRAEITATGKRHPVTRDLPGSETSPPKWSPWMRLVSAERRSGHAVMAGPGDQPLLLLSREGKGRVSLLLSDHAWLWAREYGAGGPYLDLLRRTAHWLMKEPELEEEALRLKARGNELTIERQSLGEKAGDVTLFSPDGESLKLTLQPAEPGLWRANFVARKQGLWRAEEGQLKAFANVGPPNPREVRDLASSTAVLAAAAAETGGSVRRIESGSGIILPRIVDIRAGANFAGSDYIGLKPGEASIVKSIGLFGLTAGLAGLLLLLGAALAAWLREGRSARSPKSA